MPLPKAGVEWPPKDRTTPVRYMTDAYKRWQNLPGLDERKRTLPIGSDIAQTSADLLFGEPLNVRLEDTVQQGRLEAMLSEQGVQNKLLEGAEMASSLGGVYLRPVWDYDIQEEPILTISQPQHALPEWRYGRLRAVTFFREIDRTDAGTIVWHLERHETTGSGRGVILHAVYTGDAFRLDAVHSTDYHPTTRGLPERLDVAGTNLVVRYVPNALPNRWIPSSNEGRWDWQGAEDIMDDANSIWSSWMRDIRVGKARLIVPREFIRTNDLGAELQDGTQMGFFDFDQEVYDGLAMSAAERTIESHQFKIRVDEHERSLMQAFERTIDHAGYAPQSFGLRIEGRAESGTALRVREGKTFRTNNKKARYWQPSLRDILQIMLSGKSISGNTLVVTMDDKYRPAVEVSDPAVDDPMENAQVLTLLANAKLASQETLVKLAQPHLEGDELADELRKIQDDKDALAAPLPFSTGDLDAEI